jgi:hypothetical protein
MVEVAFISLLWVPRAPVAVFRAVEVIAVHQRDGLRAGRHRPGQRSLASSAEALDADQRRHSSRGCRQPLKNRGDRAFARLHLFSLLHLLTMPARVTTGRRQLTRRPLPQFTRY